MKYHATAGRYRSLGLRSGSTVRFLALLLAFSLSCSAQQTATLSDAVVKSLSGKVSIGDTGSVATRAARKGEPLTAGQSVKTGENGIVELTLAGTGTILIEKDSEVAMPAIAQKTAPQESLSALKGKLFMTIDAETLKKQGNREFRLKTPTTILAVKGTKFFVAVAATGDTIGVHAGEVLVMELVSRKSEQIRTGMAVEAAPQKLSPPRALSIGELAGAVSYSGGGVVPRLIPFGDKGECLTLGFLSLKPGVCVLFDPAKQAVQAFGRSPLIKNGGAIYQFGVYHRRETRTPKVTVIDSVGSVNLVKGSNENLYALSEPRFFGVVGHGYEKGESVKLLGIPELSIDWSIFETIRQATRLEGQKGEKAGAAREQRLAPQGLLPREGIIEDKLPYVFEDDTTSAAFARTAAGGTDMNNIYFTVACDVYQVTKESAGWIKPKLIAELPIWINGIVMTSANTAYVVSARTHQLYHLPQKSGQLDEMEIEGWNERKHTETGQAGCGCAN